MNFHEVSREEAEQLHPLVNFDGIRCIMFEPDGGNVDPSGVTNAYATGRGNGVRKSTFTPPWRPQNNNLMDRGLCARPKVIFTPNG